MLQYVTVALQYHLLQHEAEARPGGAVSKGALAESIGPFFYIKIYLESMEASSTFKTRMLQL